MRTGALYKDREDPLMTHMYIYNKGSLEFILFHVRGCSLILITTLKFKTHILHRSASFEIIAFIKDFIFLAFVIRKSLCFKYPDDFINVKQRDLPTDVLKRRCSKNLQENFRTAIFQNINRRVLLTNKLTLLKISQKLALRKKCSYLEFIWSVFSNIWTEYGGILRISPYSL